MPELPEVETIAADLRSKKLEGAEILKTEVYWERSIACPSAKEFCQTLRQTKILKVHRQGKYLVFDIQGALTLAVHLKMSGRFFLTEARSQEKHEHVAFYLKDGRILFFHDTRKFGKMHLTNRPEKLFERLGPDPTKDSFTWEHFKERAERRKGKLKALLLDQSFLCGLGNIYVDESLWEAKLHPERDLTSLTENELQALFKAVKKVLLQGIEKKGTSLGHGKGNFHSLENRGSNQDFLKVYKRDGMPCLRCKDCIVRLVIASRGTHICPSCQKLL
jgi:formamidopyrimidine-DNA glycosylase